MVMYRGRRADGVIEVTKDGVPLDPVPSQRLWNHSPDGPNWGYGGSGPAQLALMLALEVVGEARAIAIYQRLKAGLVARWKTDEWALDQNELRTYCLFLLEEDRKNC